jgi:hypothetical protein
LITAVANNDDGTQIIILGITRGNLDRLVAGEPVMVRAESHPGFPPGLRIAIFFGETERDLTIALKPLIKDDTKIVAVEKPTHREPS